MGLGFLVPGPGMIKTRKEVTGSMDLGLVGLHTEVIVAGCLYPLGIS